MAENRCWKRYGTFILYNIFGLTATALETSCYWLFFSKLELGNVVSTIIATFITITYAFFTNKILVYKSKDWRLKTMYAEVSEFYGFRIVTGLFNVGYMYLTVSILNWPAIPMKIISALIVGMMNYMLGKKVVFKNRRRRRRKKTVESN